MAAMNNHDLKNSAEHAVAESFQHHDRLAAELGPGGLAKAVRYSANTIGQLRPQLLK